MTQFIGDTNVRWSPEDQNFKGTIVIDDGALAFGGTNAASNIATTRTNLGLAGLRSPTLVQQDSTPRSTAVEQTPYYTTPTERW
jgi:hypothetical protein